MPSKEVSILAIGDIVGKPGRRAVNELLPDLRQRLNLDLVIANGENAAGGFGLTPATADELLDSGVDVITSGNHIWAQRDIIPVLESDAPILRPLNYPTGVPGRGYMVMKGVLVVNLIGTTFMNSYDSPFHKMDSLLAELKNRPRITVIDFHAEATSEKVALGRYLDGRVTAVLGTHTHVGTVDTRLLPGGSAYVTDIGMTGPEDSVIGDDADSVIQRFLTMMPHHLSVGRGRPVFGSVLVKADPETGRANSIERLDLGLEV
jgi:metallophosphoesterase (TIGR00282 family)